MLLSLPRALHLFAALASVWVVCVNGFCETGVSPTVLHPQVPISVYWIQAPLFSNKYGPVPGALLHAYHTALLFVTPSTNFTLEFDAAAGVGPATVPLLQNSTTGVQLVWRDQARFCFTEGILWGRKHWRTSFQLAIDVTGKDFNKLVTEYIPPHNASQTYQLWRVLGPRAAPLVLDNTCGDGAVSVLRYLVSRGNKPKNTHALHTSSVVVRVDGISRVDPDRDLANLTRFYRELSDLEHHPWKMLPQLIRGRKFVHHNVNNTHMYHELHGVRNLTVQLVEHELTEPSRTASSTVVEVFVAGNAL